MTSKNPHPQPKIFVNAKYRTCRVFWAFEQLSTAFSARVMLTQSHVWSGCFGANCFI